MLCLHEKYEILNYPDQQELAEHAVGYLFGKNDYIQHKKFIYIQYIYNTIFYKVLGKYVSSLWWVQIEKTVNQKKSFVR